VSGSGAPERGEEGTGSTEGETAFDQAFLGGGADLVLGQHQFAIGVGEVLVLDADDLVTANRDVAATGEAQ
jgi:hypothetical protein